MAKEPLSRLQKLQALFDEKKIVAFGETELSRLHQFVHFWITVGKSFARNRCPVRASALAYTMLLALVPLLAVGISISTSFLKREGGKQQIEQLINTLVAKVAPQLDLVSKSDRLLVTDEQKKLQKAMLAKYDANQNGKFDKVERDKFSEEDQLEMAKAGVGQISAQQKVAESISSYVNNVSSGKLGATAVIALVFVGISLLSTIEATVNDIWGVTQGRSWFARIVQYWAVITLGPILLLVAMGLNVGPYFETTNKILHFSPFIGNVIYKLLPLAMLVGAFTLFYQLMPNTKVKWRASLIGGSVGGLLWYLNNVFGVAFFGQQIARNSQIYGKLAIMPVFLLGIYFSWLIVLFGAQVAYSYQNRRAYIQEKQTENVNERGCEFVALRLMTFIAQLFHWGERPPSSAQIAESLGVPSQLVGKVMEPLLKSKLILRVASPVSDETAYAPARPLDQISYQDILDSIRAGTGQELETRDDSSRTVVRGKFDEILKAERAVAGSITLRTLVQDERLG